MKTSLMSAAVMSALFVSAMSVTSVVHAAAVVSIDTDIETVVKENRAAEVTTKLIVMTDAADSSAVENKNHAKSSATSHFSFVGSNRDDANTVIISNALANAFSSKIGSDAGGIAIHNASVRSIKKRAIPRRGSQ